VIPGLPLTALAPMQRITDLPFMRVIAEYGPPDYFFTEYFRIHPAWNLEKSILQSITENRTGRPVFAQIMGEDVSLMRRAVAELGKYPIAGVDLNMGCPVPAIYKRNVGGGLLRDPEKVDEVLGALRAATRGLFTVKMRVGFESPAHFDRILALINQHSVDLLSLHGRTVMERYNGDVHYDLIAHAVRVVKCPVLANGNITSAEKAARVLAETGAAGVMLGRHAIRNPFIFRQCRERFQGLPLTPVSLLDIRGYVEKLYRAMYIDGMPVSAQVNATKRFLNFVGTSVDPRGMFIHDMRRANTDQELFAVCDRYLTRRGAEPFELEPFSGVLARPNCES